jgi:four helix bundle protein
MEIAMEADNKTGRAQGFEELKCYQFALKLLDATYKLAANLPDYEKYNLASQIRRAALSIVLNIAEGYGRYHYLDKLRFFYMARGSLSETRSAFIAAHTVGHIDDVQCQWACNVESETQKSLNGYIDYIRRQQQGKKEFGPTLLKEDRIEYALIPDSLPPDSLTPDSLAPDSLIPDSLSPDSLIPDS